MKKLTTIFFVGLITAFNLCNQCYAQYTKLLDFSGTTNGELPQGSLISDGTFLYGMTSQGGTNDMGVIFKIKPDGTPNVIYLGESMAELDTDGCRIILPITDPYVSHHSALGSFATIYCPGDSVGCIKNALQCLNGIIEVLERGEASKKYALPAVRIGDLVIIADQDTVLGKTPKDHDLSLLKGPLRSHGGLAETVVPFGFSGPINTVGAKTPPRNFELFDYLINRM